MLTMSRKFFLLSFISPLVMHIYLQALVPQRSIGPSANAQEPFCKNPDLCKDEFRQTLMGVGAAGDGTLLDVRTFETQNEIKLTTVHGHFASSSAAIAELERRASKASKIIEKGERTAFGLSAGQRVLAMTSPLKSENARPTVLLTEGTEFYEIISPSMQLVLEFEARYYSLKRDKKVSGAS